MPKIFISYRRSDSRKDAGRIYDHMIQAFGKENVFIDAHNIPLGKDFRVVLREAVESCDVQLVIIGKQWLRSIDEFARYQLQNPEDFVRIEIESALERDNCVVIPVLVDHTPMPRADELPPSLVKLTQLNAVFLEDDPYFLPSMQRLIKYIEENFLPVPTQSPKQRSKSHFFISYAKKDTRDLAIALSDALNALPDVTAWVDRSLKAGASWETQIQREIKNCDYFIVLYSPDLNRHLEDESLSESYVLNEISYAKEILKKPVIPVMVQPTTPPISLIRMHYIDFTISGLSLKDLLESICGEAGIHLQGTASVGTVSIPSAAPKITPPSNLLLEKGMGTKAKSLLPQPFDWCEIPVGKVRIKEGGYIPKGGQSFDISTFLIAKYPITNSQFAEFIDADGYKNENWWTKAGWQQKEKDNWIEPRNWKDTLFNEPEQPVVGVSWYESIAFCLWLSEISGEKIMLPSEQQWQRAAQGDSGRAYPWGRFWNAERCNNSVLPKSSKVTSLVTDYEKQGNISPYNVVDMAGNVWEWCFTEFETGNQSADGTNSRILRGGSWYNSDPNHFRSTYHFNTYPYHTGNVIGFRIALNLE